MAFSVVTGQHMMTLPVNGSAVGSFSQAFTNPIGNGNHVAGIVYGLNFNTSLAFGLLGSIADDKGNSYTVPPNGANASYATFSTTAAMWLFYRLNITNAPQTVTITWTSGDTAAYSWISMVEFTGGAAILDGYGCSNPTATGTPSSPTWTTTGTGDIVYGSFVNPPSDYGTFTQSNCGAGFTLLDSTAASTLAEYLIQSSPSASTAITGNPGGSDSWLIGGMAFAPGLPPTPDALIAPIFRLQYPPWR